MITTQRLEDTAGEMGQIVDAETRDGPPKA